MLADRLSKRRALLALATQSLAADPATSSVPPLALVLRSALPSVVAALRVPNGIGNGGIVIVDEGGCDAFLVTGAMLTLTSSYVHGLAGYGTLQGADLFLAPPLSYTTCVCGGLSALCPRDANTFQQGSFPNSETTPTCKATSQACKPDESGLRRSIAELAPHVADGLAWFKFRFLKSGLPRLRAAALC